jgi:hypothetical protein
MRYNKKYDTHYPIGHCAKCGDTPNSLGGCYYAMGKNNNGHPYFCPTCRFTKKGTERKYIS